jgi:ribosomal protein S18 acetylase RimI-like enzyme
MATYVLRSLNSGNISLNKFINFKQVGSIIGRPQNNELYIYNLNVSIENRRKKHGSEILNTYETLMKHNYGIENIYISAWENVQYPESVNSFYIHNGYQKLDKKPLYYDNKIDLFEINKFFKKL